MKKHISAFAFFLFAFGVLLAQKDSLKVGVVLSGGGSKGAAHIGFLRALEETGVRPSYLTGTSIGAIVGAYYAAGYSSAQIDSIFHHMDFDQLMSDRLPRRYLPVEEKKKGRNELFYFPINSKDYSLSFPQGLTHYQLFYNRLFRDLFNIQYVSHFDSLPMPVRFVATDLVEGNPVIYDSGSIPEAVAASAAFPSIVAPLKIRGQLVSDGGIFDNFPVDVMERLHPDYIIGSDVQGSLLKENQITDVTKVIDQITSFYIYSRQSEQVRKIDLYFRHPVEHFGVTDFDALDSLIRIGYRNTIRRADTLTKVGRLSRHPRRLYPSHPDSLMFSYVKVEADRKINRQYILWKTGLAPHKKIAFDRFFQGINYLYGTGDFLQIYYYIKPGDTLVLQLRSDTIRNKFKLGLRYSPLYKINILTGVVARNLFRTNGTADLEVILGDPLQYSFSYINDNGYHFGYGFESSLNQFARRVSYPLFFPQVLNPSFNTMDLRWNTWRNRIFFLTTLPTQMNFKIGLEQQKMNVYTTVFSSGSYDRKYFFDNHYYGGAFADFYYDDLNDFYFPEYGIKIELKGKAFSEYERKFSWRGSYKELSFDIEAHKHYGKNLSLSYIVQSGLTVRDSVSDAFYYYFGGVEPDYNNDHIVSYYARDYFWTRAKSYALLQGQMHYRWEKNHHFYLGLQYLLREKNQQPRFVKFLPSYDVYLKYGFDSFFGPVFVYYGIEPLTGKQYLNFTVGFYF